VGNISYNYTINRRCRTKLNFKFGETYTSIIAGRIKISIRFVIFRLEIKIFENVILGPPAVKTDLGRRHPWLTEIFKYTKTISDIAFDETNDVQRGLRE
jgi:hypothetical protein